MDERLNKPTFAVALIVAVFLGIGAGERLFGNGPDYLEYYFAYQEIRLSDTLDVIRFEPGYVLASWIAKFILRVEFATFFSILAVLSLVLKFYLFARYKQPALTIIFYLCCWYLLHEYIQIRVAVALAFTLLAADLFFHGRLIGFGAAIAVAISFHASAIAIALIIPAMYLLANLRMSIALALVAAGSIISGLFITLMLQFASQLNPLVEAYSENLEGFVVNIFSGANLLTVLLLLVIYCTGGLATRRDKTLFLLTVAALAVAVVFQGYPTLSHRMKEALLVFLVPLAFNRRLTVQALPQFFVACLLASWVLYSFFAQGLIT